MRTVLEADEGSSISSFTAKSDTPNLEFVSIHVKSVVHMMREGVRVYMYKIRIEIGYLSCTPSLCLVLYSKSVRCTSIYTHPRGLIIHPSYSTNLSPPILLHGIRAARSLT
jgi:hypothetical protein